MKFKIWTLNEPSEILNINHQTISKKAIDLVSFVGKWITICENYIILGYLGNATINERNIRWHYLQMAHKDIISRYYSCL